MGAGRVNAEGLDGERSAGEKRDQRTAKRGADGVDEIIAIDARQPEERPHESPLVERVDPPPSRRAEVG